MFILDIFDLIGLILYFGMLVIKYVTTCYKVNE